MRNAGIANPTAGNYYIQVKPYQVTGNNYDLRWSTVGSSGGDDQNSGGYNIELVFANQVSSDLAEVFNNAAKRWEDVIIGNLPNAYSDWLDRAVDDLVIVVNIENIDGRGGILGQAGPRELRDSGLPLSGEMTFDLADLEIVQARGSLEDLILHEMAHIFGFGVGSLWYNNLQGRNSQQPRFTGSQANREYQRIFGFNAQDSVPVEATGGPGTAYAHWEMGSFPGELMIGYLNVGAKMPLSRITAAALADFGYQVNLNAADDYNPLRASAVSTQAITTTFDIHNNVHIIRGNNQDNEIEGTSGNDRIEVSAGNNLLSGLEGDDTITGGPDRDTLVGGPGNDVLTGGRGRDFFHFDSLDEGVDTVTDFNTRADFISVSRSGFSGNLSRGPLDSTEFTSVYTFNNLDDNFSLGFVYSRSDGQLAFLDQDNDITLTPFAVLEGDPRLNSRNIRVF